MTWRDYSSEVHLHRRSWVRFLLLAAGHLCLVLGVIGIFLPVLPTVPFILLASVCYAKASQRFYNWIMNHRFFGPPLREWRETRSLPFMVKCSAIGMIVFSAGLSIIFLIPNLWVDLAVGATCTAVIIYLWKIPTRP